MTTSSLSRLLHLDSVESTNNELHRAARQEPDDWPHFGALLTDAQTAGRGRANRNWHTSVGEALTASLLLRPRRPRAELAWTTMLTSLAASRALRSLSGVEVRLKWPNDLVVATEASSLPDWGRLRKLGGVLTEVIEAPQLTGERAGVPGLVVGIGINLTQPAGSLPVTHAASLHSIGALPPPPLVLLEQLGAELAELLDCWERQAGSGLPAELHEAVSQACWSLGTRVRVELPGGVVREGMATSLDDGGRLVLEGTERVSAGDVQHLRDAGEVAR